MTVSELADTLRSRDVLFNVFSKVFFDVPDDDIDKITEETVALMASVAETTENEDVKEGFSILSGIFSERDNSISKCLSETRLERSIAYTSLFILGKESESVYESVHRSPEKLLKQESWSDVKAFYLQNGFCRTDKMNIVEDHISIELQFMGLLSGKAADACEREDFKTCREILAVQLRFYEEHISKWIPGLCTNIAEHKDKVGFAFYSAYAFLLKGFIAEDMLFLTNGCGFFVQEA
jgi:TorA maturation chaperone TorD